MDLPDRRLLTVREVADATGLSPNAIYRAISAGELRASKLRGRLRIRLADLDAWVNANVVNANVHSEHRVGADWRTSGIEASRNEPGRGLRELLKKQ